MSVKLRLDRIPLRLSPQPAVQIQHALATPSIIEVDCAGTRVAGEPRSETP